MVDNNTVDDDELNSVKYDMQSNSFVTVIETQDKKFAVVPVDETGEDRRILCVHDSYDAVLNSDAVDLYHVPEHVVKKPEELMETIIAKGVEACFENPNFSDFAVMYADRHTETHESPTTK